jgi:hypothetical protein
MKNQFYFDHYNPEALHKIIDTQHKVIEYQKNRIIRNVFSILIIVDDFADQPQFTRQNKILHLCILEERHNSISTITATQTFSAIAPIIRVNAT